MSGKHLSRRQFLGASLGVMASTQTPIASIIDISDLGATGDGQTDVTDVIQAAINSLVGTGGTVFLPSGTYRVSRSIEIGVDGVTLMGEGFGATIIKLVDNVPDEIVGIVRTPSAQINKFVTVRDLTIDGNRENQNPEQNNHYGFYCGVTPDEPDADEDITCVRVEIRNCTGYGFDPHQAALRLALIDCVSHHNGIDGFTIDNCIDSIIRGCISYENDRHGFNLVTNSTNIVVSENIANNNGANGITVQNGSRENLINSNTVYGNQEDGIYIIGVDDNVVMGNYVHQNGNYGIRIRGCPNTTISNNRLHNNSQSEHEGYDEIQVTDDGDRGSFQCMIANNHITVTSDVRARYGIHEPAGDSAAIQNENMFSTNKVSGVAREPYRFEGRRSALIANS